MLQYLKPYGLQILSMAQKMILSKTQEMFWCGKSLTSFSPETIMYCSWCGKTQSLPFAVGDKVL